MQSQTGQGSRSFPSLWWLCLKGTDSWVMRNGQVEQARAHLPLNMNERTGCWLVHSLCPPNIKRKPAVRDTYVLSILDKALNDDYGIEVQAGSPKTFRQYCFSARKRYREQTGDDRYESLIIRFAPHDPENLLYIMKQEYLDNARIYGKVSGEE